MTSSLALTPLVRRSLAMLRALSVVLLAVLGATLVVDRPGLEAEYFALTAPWEGKPFYTAVGEPRLANAPEIRQVSATQVIFSVRWSGWWRVQESGSHRFALRADDGGYLKIDDELLVDTRGVFGEPLEGSKEQLDPGFHRIEVGLYQTHGKSSLALDWSGPDSADDAPRTLDSNDLFGGRPLGLRRALRGVFAGWSVPFRRLLGVAGVVLALLAARRHGRKLATVAAGFSTTWPRVPPRRLRAALLFALVAVAFVASFPYTGALRGGDDTAYLNAAMFDEQRWFSNRYAHVYLLKSFIAAAGGDPVLGTRLWWSVAFAVTVGSLALAVRAIGPGLQLRTLAVTLYVLLAQSAVMGSIGAAFADYTAMMFVTAAVGAYLHGISGHGRSGRGRHDWNAFLIGALSLAAFRSKEVGAVLFLLPLLFLIRRDGVSVRQFARRLTYWILGAMAVLAVLAGLDAWILGDAFFTFDGDRLAQMKRMNFPEYAAPRGENESWLKVLWRPRAFAAGLSLRNLWCGVLVAAIVAGFRCRRLELRLLHLLPLAYLLALIVLYVRLPHPFSERMLIPILPTACLMTGLLLHHAGLDALSWRRLLSPWVLTTVASVAAVVFLIAVPYRSGTLSAASFLPAATLERFGWQPDSFVIGVLLPGLVLVAAGGLALRARSREAWIAALLVALLVFFGLGFEFNRASLAKGFAVKKTELLLYPWTVFGERLDEVRPQTVALSPELQHTYEMSAETRSALARLALRRRDVYVVLARDAPSDVDVAIASRGMYRTWRRQRPELEATASADPAGLLVFVEPKRAAQALAAENPP